MPLLTFLANLGFAGGGGTPTGYAFTGDLTTVFCAYLDALHDSAIVASDSDTLIANDVDEMISGSTDRRDLNTRYFEYLH